MFTAISQAGVVWSDPVLLTELNDATNGSAFYPHLSRDGVTLYFGRYVGSERQLFTATKNQVSGQFENISQINELAFGDNLYTPWVSDNGLRLYYGKYESGIELYMASRNSVSDAWITTVSFSDIHSDGDLDSYPSLTSDELTMFYVSDRGRNRADTRIWMATRSSVNEQFSNPTLVSELDFGQNVLGPCILPDGLTLYYAAKSNNQYDIFRATRDSLSDPFSGIESISLNTPFGIESSPYVTPDESEIFFVSPEGIWYAYQVPEPATLALLGVGMLLMRRKK